MYTYLDVTDALGDRGRNQHGSSSDAARNEENGSQLALGQVKLASKEVGHPRSISN